MFVYGSEVENCNVCHCYWFADCVATWLVGSRTQAVSPPLKLNLCTLERGRGEGDVWMSFVCVCELFCKESFKVEIILIKTIKPPPYTFHGTSLHQKALFFFSRKCPEMEECLNKQLYT